jgi:LysR family glycine cleavage system transcriptional activator
MTDRLPSLTGLRAFEAAARHLSFTKAAAELGVTQTAISHQIRRLEEQLGLKLFVRGTRQVMLTREAQGFLPAVRRAFDDLRRASAELTRPGRASVLTVTTLPSFAAKWLVPRLAGFQEAHPEVEVRVSTSSQLVDFRRDDIDVGLRYGKGDWPGLRADWLMSEDVFPVCSPRLLEGPHPLRTPDDLAHHTLLHEISYREDWRMWLTAAGRPDLTGARMLSFDLQVSAIQAAIDGLGVALGRSATVEADLAAGRLVKPFDISLPADAGFYIVALRERAEEPKIRAFRDWLLGLVAARAA